jgi:hypothetical protein
MAFFAFVVIPVVGSIFAFLCVVKDAEERAYARGYNAALRAAERREGREPFSLGFYQ